MQTVTRLSEGIQHLEDLPIDEFLDTVRNMSGYTAQEKLDGANLWVGVDEEGKLFTSREGKRNGAERRYSPKEWPMVSAFNQFRAADAALRTKEGEIKRVMRSGDTVEVEVLFGRQPNSVTYGADGKSFIAFLRGVNDTPDEIADHLSSSLANQQANAQVEIVDTADGRDLSTTNVDVPFQFIAPQRMDAAKLKQDSGIDPLVKKLESFLKQTSSVEGKTNGELAKLDLTKVPTESRAAAKTARAAVLAQLMTDFKLPIKNALLAKTGGKSALAAKDITPDEDVGIEGIVLRDPSSGRQVKVVDKDVFTAINRFNQSMRGEVQSALNTVDPDAPLEARGGLIGQLRIRIADALGNRELAKPSNVRKILGGIKGKDPVEAIKNLAGSLSANEDFQGAKKKVLAMASETYKELDERLQYFQENKANYRMKLKNGKEIGLSDETVKKTLLTFAEARRNLKQLFDKLKVTKTLAEMLSVLYGGSAVAVHQPIEEGLLFEKKKAAAKKHPKKTSLKTGEISVTDFDRKDAFTVLNAYFATVFMTMIIWHTGDKIGRRLLRDRKNCALRSHALDMSPMNHWGFAIWKNSRPELEKHLTKATRITLQKATKHIPQPWWRYLHMDFSSDGEVKISWKDHLRTLRRLMELTGIRSDRLNTLLDVSMHFDKLDADGQREALKKVIAYAHTHVDRSKLLLRLRTIDKQMKDAKDPMVAESLLRSVAALTEDGEGADSGEGFEVAQTGNGASAGTQASAIGNVPMKLGIGKRKTVMMRRTPEAKARVQRMSLKFKDPRKDE